MPSIVIANLVHCYSIKKSHSVWIIPGSLDDFEDPQNEDLYPHINDYLLKRGILVCEKVEPEKAVDLVELVSTKFRIAGFEVSMETLVDD